MMRVLLVLALLGVAGGCAPSPAPGAASAGDESAAGGPWDASWRAGFAFRGVGQEPGWTVEIAPERSMRAVLDYGERTVSTGRPAETRDGARTVYTAREGATELRVGLEETPCADAMSGERMTHRVTLHVDGRELQGCGRMLPVSGGELVDGHWKLEELDGRPAVGGAGPGAPYLRIDAAAGQASGSTGCNSFGGPVEIEDGRIRFGTLAMTRMACLDDRLMEQERRFAQALEAADGYALEGGMLALLAGERVVARFTAMEAPPARE